MGEHHAGCAISEKLGDVCTCGAEALRPPEASRAPPFWIVRRMQPGLQIKIKGHFFRHETRAGAEAEAIRLAMQFRGARFVVLEAVATITVREDSALSIGTTPKRATADAIEQLTPVQQIGGGRDRVIRSETDAGGL